MMRIPSFLFLAPLALWAGACVMPQSADPNRDDRASGRFEPAERYDHAEYDRQPPPPPPPPVYDRRVPPPPPPPPPPPLPPYRDHDRDRDQDRDHRRNDDHDRDHRDDHMDRDGFRRNVDRLEHHADEFRHDLDRALDKSRLDGSHREDDLNRQMQRVEHATDRLKARKNDEPREVREEVSNVVEEGRAFEGLISNSRGLSDGRRGWDNLRGSINELAVMFRLNPIANVPGHGDHDGPNEHHGPGGGPPNANPGPKPSQDWKPRR